MTGEMVRVFKKRLRKETLAVRSRLSEEERYKKSRAISARLFETPEFDRAGFVMAYMDFRGEAGTSEIIAECFKRGKKVALPVVTDCENGVLSAFEACSGQAFVRNGYGICEPDPDFSNRVLEEKIDLVVVPGVVFDLLKYRIGYGAGYYDRFLPKLRHDCLSVGIAYDFQVVDSLPSDAYDIPLDMIITERRLIK